MHDPFNRDLRAIFKKFQQHVYIVQLRFIWKTRVIHLMAIHKKSKPRQNINTKIEET